MHQPSPTPPGRPLRGHRAGDGPGRALPGLRHGPHFALWFGLLLALLFSVLFGLSACGGGSLPAEATPTAPIVIVGAPPVAATDSPMQPFRLRAELQADPVGLQTALPRLGWAFDAAAERGLRQTAYQLRVAASAERLAAGEGDLWDSGVVEAADSQQRYAGPPLSSWTRAHWAVRVRDQAGRWSAWSPRAEFTVGLLDTADWNAAWVGAAAGAALPLFRREFTVERPLRRALLAVCGLGQFELRVNGHSATDAVLEPAATDFTKTCTYSLYDVTALLAPGANALALMLGRGMYDVQPTDRYTKFTGSQGPLKFILRLRLELADGSVSGLASDAGWNTAAGPVSYGHVYGGEDFDARREPAGWDRPGFDDRAWASARVLGGAAPRLLARTTPAVKVMQTFEPQVVTQPAPGVFVYDLGRNFSGWPEIVVQGAAGTTVRLTPGETLRDGRVSQAGSGSPMWFSYTLKNGPAQTWRPRFSTAGLRYVEVEGAVPPAQAAAFPGRPLLLGLKGLFVHSSAEAVGRFTSSDDDLNRIHALILGAMRSNLQHILTDCPHRERLGWLESSHLLASGLMFNHDLGAFYEKIVRDARDAQTAGGLVPNIAPEFTVFEGDFRDSPEWGSAFVLNPWQLWQMYGVREPLAEHYADMTRYLAHLEDRSRQDLLSHGLGDWYDLGPNPPGASQRTSAGLTATAVWLQDLQVMAQAARLLGAPADAARFEARRATVLAAYNRRFLAGGRYDFGSQTANGMPLALGLVPEDQRARVLAALVSSVTDAGHAVTAGDIGFGHVLRALSDAGRGDLVFSMLKQSAAPGYLYQLQRGATTLTEAWDANPASSQNHAMLGHAEGWFFHGLGGLQPDLAGPGFAQFIVRPTVPPGLDAVAVEYLSVRGAIRSQWIRSQWIRTAAGLALAVDVPPNTTATVFVPTRDPGSVTEGGAPLSAAAGVLSTAVEAGALRITVGSGQYRFLAP